MGVEAAVNDSPHERHDAAKANRAAFSAFAVRVKGRVDRALSDRLAKKYAEVLVHWGNAKPRSVTADKARTHMKALGCSK